VQLIEVSVTGVRSAAITLRRADTPLRFVLLPMLHLGSPAFYREVTERLGRCQVVVAEGIRGRSLIARAQRCQEPIEVAVVYGAEHMASVIRYLLGRYGYRPREAQWLTVFDL
jgi:hypothetical protein